MDNEPCISSSPSLILMLAIARIENHVYVFTSYFQPVDLCEESESYLFIQQIKILLLSPPVPRVQSLSDAFFYTQAIQCGPDSLFG